MNLFSIFKRSPKKEKFKEYKEPIRLSHDADENYEIFKKEVEWGATHYRILDDHDNNALYDLDDLEDTFCFLKIQLFYKDKNKRYDRYTVMGHCSNINYLWEEIDPSWTKEQVNDFIVGLGKSKIW